MSKERLYIFDTTLRDGAQTQGVDFSVDDKLKIATALDNLGVDYIEGGWPGANPTDTEFFQKKHAFTNAKLTSFGMTKRSGRSAENDTGLSALLNSIVSAVTSPFSVTPPILRVTLSRISSSSTGLVKLVTPSKVISSKVTSSESPMLSFPW